MEIAEPGVAICGGGSVLRRVRRHDRPDEDNAVIRDQGSLARQERVASTLVRTGSDAVPPGRLHRPTRTDAGARSLQVGDEIGEHAVSSGTHAHEFDRDSRAVTKCSYMAHGAEEPRVYFHQDLGLSSEVKRGGGFDAFDATSAQAQVAEPAAQEGAV